MIKLSIIIPTCNRRNQLDKTLKSLFETTVDVESFEIIVVDNNSTDDTSALVLNYISKFPGIHLRYIYDSIPGLLTGRHRGSEEAKGDILSYIDDDVIIPPNWAGNIIRVLEERSDISFLTGPNLPLYETYPPDWLNYFWLKTPYGGKMCTWLSLLDMGNEEIEIRPGYVWGLNFTVRKKDFLELGGFHPDNIPTKYQMFQGDGESGFTRKAYNMGKKALYHPGIMLYHQVPASRLTFEYFDKRAYYQGVANSFTLLRDKFLNDNKKGNPSFSIYNLIKSIGRKIKAGLRAFNTMLSAQKTSKIEIDLNTRFQKKTIEGFEFHNQMFYKHDEVKNWVLKQNYLDYKLPEL